MWKTASVNEIKYNNLKASVDLNLAYAVVNSLILLHPHTILG